VGPFRTALGGYKHILVAVDKFTKWIEVRPVAKVTSEEEIHRRHQASLWCAQ
jgi:hypothetical protein